MPAGCLATREAAAGWCRPSAWPAFLALHTGAGLCLRLHRAWCGAKGSQDPTASSAVSLPCPILAKQGTLRRPATAGARCPCPYL